MALFNKAEQPGNVDSAPPGRPDLKALEGGSETSPPTGDLRSVPDSPESLGEREQAAGQQSNTSGANNETDQLDQHENQVGSGYKQGGQARGKLLQRITVNRRRAILGGGIATALISLLLFFFSLLPLKILHIVTNFENRFFATSQNAVSKESEKMFSSYITKRVMPGLSGSCPSTRISRSCVAPITGTDPISKLYDGWRQGRIENKLYEKYGIEIAKGSDGKLRISSRDLPSGGVNVTALSGTNRNIFDEPGLSHGEFRSKLREAFAGETRVKQAFLYWKYGGFIDKKYGHKRCLVGCNLKDRTTDKIADKKLVGKAWLAQRVLEPRSAMLGLALQCVLSGGSCDPDLISKDADGKYVKGPDGQPVSQLEVDLQAKLQDYRLKYGNDKLREVVKLGKVISEKGYSRYAIEQVLGKVFNKTVSAETSQQLASAVPIAGWINSIVNTADFLQTAGPKVAKMTYVINASTMVSIAGVYGTAADEMKSGDTDATELGSLTDTLNPSADGPGAEASPLYGALIDGQRPRAVASASSGLLTSVAYAASATDKTNFVTCNNGKPVPAGKLVCPEERLDAQTTAGEAFGSISNFLNMPVLGSTLHVFIDVWRSTIGGIINTIGSVFGSAADAAIPQSVKDAATSAIQPFADFVTQQLIPSVVSDNSSGARLVDLMAGGFDVSGNDCAHYCIGGQKLSNQQLATILGDQAGRNKDSINSQPLLARIFDPKNSSSVVGQTILHTSPDGSLASMLSGLNPFKIFGFASSQVSAATPVNDPFGVTQYGYPVDDPIFKTDPEQYWDDHCTDDKQTNDWTNAAVNNLNHDTYMPENSTANPCLLIQASADSAGAIFPGGLASQGDASGSGSTPTTAPAYQLLTEVNGYKLTANEAKNLKYIADSILPLLQGSANQKAALAARVAWWSLKEGVLGLHERPTDPFGYSNCGGAHTASRCSTARGPGTPAPRRGRRGSRRCRRSVRRSGPWGRSRSGARGSSPCSIRSGVRA